jgi:hydrogenase maturation factor
MQELEAQAARLHMEILGGHTEVSPALKEPVLSLTGIGKRRKRAGTECRLLPGQDVVLSKWIGIEGTMRLAEKEEVRARFSPSFVGQAEAFRRYISVVPEAEAALKSCGGAMHDVSEGGIFHALWESAEGAGVGLDIDLRKIPVRQETIELCEVFDINPYFLPSAGALLIGTEDGPALVEQLKRQQIPAAVIGKATAGRDRIVRSEEEVRYLEPPRPENLYHIKEHI